MSIDRWCVGNGGKCTVIILALVAFVLLVNALGSMVSMS